MPSSDYQRIEQALAYVEAHAEQQPTLAAIAGALGLSESHCHRLFHQWAGVTPKDFLQVLTLARAKRLLSASKPLLETSLEVGLSGTGRLHDLFVTLEAMTPGQYQRGAQGVAIAWGVHPTPLGDALVAATERGVCGLSFLESDADDPLAALRARWPEADFAHDPGATAAIAEEVAARIQGAPTRPLSLVLKGTPFQIKVWEALLRVPEGQVITYQGLAEAAGAPRASRAVGSAMAANTIGYLIPCHRVIRASGALGDYRWGVMRKQILLALEGARGCDSTP